MTTETLHGMLERWTQDGKNSAYDWMWRDRVGDLQPLADQLQAVEYGMRGCANAHAGVLGKVSPEILLLFANQLQRILGTRK